MDCLMLRLDAPLMSFGGVVIDQINPVERFPGRSLLTGLLANALGWDHRDHKQLDALQARLRHAARWDAEPTRVVDYHTVDLGQPFMRHTGWTTRGYSEDRKGAPGTRFGTHQRYRYYWAGGCATAAVALDGDGVPSLDALEDALRHPARPLFIGRKTCLPSTPVFVGRRRGPTLRGALVREPLADIGPRRRPARIEGCWPIEEGGGVQVMEQYDQRDWRNNLHCGSRRYAVGFLEVSP